MHGALPRDREPGPRHPGALIIPPEPSAPDPHPAVVVILGPTAAGKSDLAEPLAAALDGEIVGADSMQVYRGLDAGTAKPGADARLRIPHHLIDVADPRHDFNLGEFVRAADEAVRSIRGRGRLPVVTGGTGMYVRGFLKGLDPAPARDARVRRALERLAGRSGEAELHRMLRRLDPSAAAGIGVADRMRLVRGLERVLLTGRPAGAGRWGGPDRYRALKIGLRMDPERLRRRIDARVERMFEAGLVAETAALLQAGVPAAGSALKALGYREAQQHLRGECDLAEAVAAVKRHTWRFSRRQMTWFRAEADVRWFEVPPEGAAVLCPEVEKYVRLRRPSR